jgi:hypothetical protein
MSYEMSLTYKTQKIVKNTYTEKHKIHKSIPK